MSRWASSLCGGVVCALAVAAMARDYPMVGHDFRYFIPRLLDTLLHIRINGWSIQWYTPTFGAGLPAYPNPQHLEYSVVQLLTLIVDPWLAVLATTVAAMAIGFVAARTLLHRIGLSAVSSTLGAVFFIGNGFYFEHMIVGHLGFQLFPLMPALLLLLVDRNHSVIANAACVGLLVAVIVYHSGFQLMIIIAVSLVLTLLLLSASGMLVVPARRVLSCAVAGVAVAVIIAAPKLYAVFALMRQFPRETADAYDAGVVQALVGFASQFGLVMAATPIMRLVGLDPVHLAGVLMRLTGASPRIGLWEVDTGVSPLLLVLLAIGLFRIATRETLGAAAPKRWSWAALLVCTWVAIEMTLARGVVYPLIQQLPIMRSLHVNVRFASVFILPMCVLAAVAFERWVQPRLTPALVWAAITVATLSPISYLLLPARAYQRTFDTSRSMDDYRRISAGERLPVTHVADVDDAQALSEGASSMRTYEPLFGYANETFAPRVSLGDVSEIRDSRFNLTNPAGLVFPELNNLQPFDRIRADEADTFHAFVARRSPSWRIPEVHHQLVLLSLAATAMAIAGAAVRVVPRRRVRP